MFDVTDTAILIGAICACVNVFYTRSVLTTVHLGANVDEHDGDDVKAVVIAVVVVLV